MKAMQVTGCIVGVTRKGSLSPAVLKKAEELLGKEVKCAVDMHSPDYRRLNPACNAEGVWFNVDSRLSQFNQMGAIHS